MAEKKLILIVDDDSEVRKLLLDFFGSKGYETLGAEDGQTGLDLARKHLPDLAVIDMLLPKEHGINVLKAIKDELFIPVVVITGIYQEDEIMQELEDFHVNAFFTKPFDLQDLLKQVISLLNE